MPLIHTRKMTNFQTISTDSDYEDNYNSTPSIFNLRNYSVKDRTPRSVKIISNDSYLSSFSDLSNFSVAPDLNYDYLDNSSYYQHNNANDNDSYNDNYNDNYNNNYDNNYNFNFNFNCNSYYNSDSINSIPRLMLSTPLIANKINQINNNYDSDNEIRLNKPNKSNKKKILVKKSIKKSDWISNKSCAPPLIKFHMNFKCNVTFTIEKLINFFETFKFKHKHKHKHKHTHTYKSKIRFKNKYQYKLKNKNKDKNKNKNKDKKLSFKLRIYDDT